MPQQPDFPEYCQPYTYLTSYTHAWPGHLWQQSAAYCRSQSRASHYRSYGSPRCGGERLGHRRRGIGCDHNRIITNVYSFDWLCIQCQHNLGGGCADGGLIVQDLFTSTASARLTLEKGSQSLRLVVKSTKWHTQCLVNLGEGWPNIAHSASVYHVVQPVPGQPWRRVARQCALCSSLLLVQPVPG